MSVDARSAVLSRVRAAVAALRPEVLPAPMESAGPSDGHPGAASTVDTFRARLTANGGQVERFADLVGFRTWLESFLEGAAGDEDPRSWIAGLEVPDRALPPGAIERAQDADVGVSMARAAAARSGTLVLDSRGGRRVQLLPSIHVVLVLRKTIFSDVAAALAGLAQDRPSGIGLHSGPSKSADIGRILVTGVHGPGRLIAAIIDDLPGGA